MENSSTSWIIIAGLTVLATAKAINWYYDIKTEEEKEQQEREKKKLQQLLQKIKQASHEQNIYKTLLEDSANARVIHLKESIRICREAVSDIPETLKHLEHIINQEVSDKTSNPYRKSALHREYARIEDATIRLKEYYRYLDYMTSLIDHLEKTESFEQLMQLDPIDSSLPREWLYPGKLVLVSMDELGKKLPPFGQTISFGRKHSATQNALALKHGNNIPVLITSVHKKYNHLFYGCVARGEIYYYHIIPQEPIEFVVDYTNKDNAIGSLYDGMVRAHLPKSELKHPTLRLLTGQKIFVFPSKYNLTLHKNPFDTSSIGIEVSEFNYATKSSRYYQQLYISIQAQQLQQITDNSFYDPNKQWTLLEYIPSTGIISLAKASVRIDCQVSNDYSLLIVQQITQSNCLTVGIDTPFRFSLIDKHLAKEEKIGWDYGVKEFLHFCTQSMRDLSKSPLRLAQARFYQHWEQTIAYQRSQEENALLEVFVNQVTYDVTNNTLTISQSQLPEALHVNFKQLYEKLRVLLENSSLRSEYYIHLDYWDKTRMEYISAIRCDHHPPLYTQQENMITIEGAFLFPHEEDCVLRLFVNIPSIPLRRQEQALKDFSLDRLVNPILKNILLAPEHYIPQQEKLHTNIAWSNKLDASQKDVVKLALREPNIALIQGPPGAGKTTAIVEILYQLFLRNPHCRVLIVSQQNTAVDNALSKFLEKYQSIFTSSVQAIRIGSQDKINADIQSLSFDQQYANFLYQLKDNAIKAATRLVGEEQKLCHSWYAKLIQLSQSTKGQEEFFITLLNNHNLVGATCIGLATNKGGIDQLQFDVAIIDEAGRATVPEILIPILRSRKVILVGDHYQLPPNIAPLLRDENAKQALNYLQENFFEESFFELMFNRLPAECKETLDKQYRMTADIGHLVANLFYSPQGKRMLFNGLPDNHFKDQYILQNSIYWIDINGQEEQCGTSKRNEREALAIVNFLKKISQIDHKSPISVAIITPYSAQKHCIRNVLSQSGWNKHQEGSLQTISVAVDTIDAFQGSEADIVCYSTVRTQGNLNFILDKKRLNVACSRARLHLLFFGHRHYLQKWKPKNKEEVNLFNQIMRYASFDPVAFKN